MKLILLFLVTNLILSGCANRLEQPEFKSGFLKDYRFFKKNPKKENSWIRTKPGFQLSDLKQYKKLALNPIEIWLDPTKKANIVSPAKQAELTAYFAQQIQRKVGEHYEFVKPGTKDSLLIKIALTNIEELTPELSPLDALPFRIAKMAGEQVYLLAMAKKAVIGSASLEVEFVDTNSNRGLAAVIVSHKTDKVNVADNETNIESIKLVVDEWVERLTQALMPQPNP